MFLMLLFKTCEEKEKIESSYKGLEVLIRQTNFEQDVPFVNYQQFLETLNHGDSQRVDFIIIEYHGRLLTVKNNVEPAEFGPDWLGSWELLKAHHLADEGIALMDCRGKYMALAKDNTIRFNEDSIKKNTIFRLIRLPNEQFAILAPNQRYLSSENSFKDVTATRTKVGNWETFTIFKLLPPK